jgi:NADPH2:quinone reductase
LVTVLVEKPLAMAAVRGILVKQFGGPEVLKYLTTIPRPSKPAAKQLLVRVKAAGVNPVDTYIRTGTHTIKAELPYTPGNDGAGVVEEVGEQVTKFKVGDRVFWCRSIDGSYKELTLTDEQFTFTLDSAVSFQQGAALGIPYFTAYKAVVSKAQLTAGESILIHGASGAVGLACCQIAKQLGARVIGTAGTDEGLHTVLENGADVALNHKQPGYTDKLQAEGGVNVIIEMLADVNLEKDLELSKFQGRIVIVGCRGKIEISPRRAMTNEISIFGCQLFRSTKSEWEEMGDFIVRGTREGWLHPVVGLEYPVEQAADAHVEVMEHKKAATKGKIVLVM